MKEFSEQGGWGGSVPCSSAGDHVSGVHVLAEVPRDTHPPSHHAKGPSLQPAVGSLAECAGRGHQGKEKTSRYSNFFTSPVKYPQGI